MLGDGGGDEAILSEDLGGGSANRSTVHLSQFSVGAGEPVNYEIDVIRGFVSLDLEIEGRENAFAFCVVGIPRGDAVRVDLTDELAVFVVIKVFAGRE